MPPPQFSWGKVRDDLSIWNSSFHKRICLTFILAWIVCNRYPCLYIMNKHALLKQLLNIDNFQSTWFEVFFDLFKGVVSCPTTTQMTFREGLFVEAGRISLNIRCFEELNIGNWIGYVEYADVISIERGRWSTFAVVVFKLWRVCSQKGINPMAAFCHI